MGTFTFELGDMVVTKADLEIERHAYQLNKNLLLISPGQVVGRFLFESKVGVEELYHVAVRGQINRHYIDELAPANELFSLWADLTREADSTNEK